MPDITMCRGDNCFKAKYCYRHEAVPSEYRQSYFMMSPVQSTGECDHYIPIKKEPNEPK